MLPAAKALLVTALLGGGTVGTYALAGGKFGPGSGGVESAETAQTSTPESTTPTTDGQPKPRVEETVPVSEEHPVAPREEVAIEGNTQNRGSSDTPAGADGGKTLEAASPAEHSPEVGAEVREGEEEETEQQRNSQGETAPADNGQKQPGTEASVVGGSDSAREKVDLEGGSDRSRTDSSGKDASESQIGQQNAETEKRGVVQENSASLGDQVDLNLPESNTAQDSQTPSQDKGDVNQADKAVTQNENTNTEGPEPVAEASQTRETGQA